MHNDNSTLKGQELTIIFIRDKGYLTQGKPLKLRQVFVPDADRTFKSPAYWKVKVLSHNEEKNKIHCNVISYHVGRTDFSTQQLSLTSKLKEIEIVNFKTIDTICLLRTMNETKPISLKPEISGHVERPQSKYSWEPEVRQPLKQSINETFYVPIKNVGFRNGGVLFKRKFKNINEKLEIAISNPEIKEEFDAVKNYFAKVLNTKKIQVTAKMEITNNKVTSVDAKSSEIDKIDEQLIKEVKHAFVKATQKKKLSDDIEKSLFTMDEYFTTLSDGKVKANTFYSNENEFFNDLLDITKTKHYKQLRFLSSKHCHKIMKLRFVHKPFSFVFLIEGDQNYHIIWETLDTKEATYIWPVPKDTNAVKMSLPKIEGIINDFKSHGKLDYISSSDDLFERFYHDYTDPVSGFLKWKSELESKLT